MPYHDPETTDPRAFLKSAGARPPAAPRTPLFPSHIKLLARIARKPLRRSCMGWGLFVDNIALWSLVDQRRYAELYWDWGAADSPGTAFIRITPEGEAALHEETRRRQRSIAQ